MAARDTLQTLFDRFARAGDAPAVIAFAGDTAHITSFAALAAASRGVANDLARRGVGPGATVAIIGPNSLNWITAYWAVVATGATVLPIDAQIGESDAGPMLAVAGCTLVFTTAARAKHLPAGCEAIVLDHDLPHADGDPTFATQKPEDIAVMLFTSGTTGTPKAVPLTHANLLSNIDAIAAADLVRKGDRALLPLPLHHAYPLTVGMMSGFACGVALILPSGVSGPEMIAALKNGRATVLMGVPRLYSALVAGIRQRIAARGALARRVVGWLFALSAAIRRLGINPGRLLFGAVHRQLAPELRLLVSGGAKLDGEVEGTLAALGWAVMTGYGLTETSPILSFNRPKAARAGSAGRPLPGVELRIVNADADGVGEIEAKGASVFKGYRGDEAAAKRAFTADGWFRTGDFGKVDGDGYLFIVARVSETIVLADGKKLFPDAVEAAYAEHPLIKEIALFAREGALVGLIVPDLDKVREAGAVGIKDMIRNAVSERGQTLPSHARLSGFALSSDKLPRTQLGKIRRHLVPKLYDAALAGHDTAAPAELSPDDQALLDEPEAAAVWEWLTARFPGRNLALDMSPQIDLGVDSLGWVDLSLALERERGVRLTEQEIGRIVTLRDLLREAKTASTRPPDEAPAEPATLRRNGAGLHLAQRLGAALLRSIMRRRFSLAVEGAEHLPASGAYLICPNHESYLDPVAVVAALPPALLPRTWWAGWTGILFTSAPRRLFSRIAQIVPVDQYRGGAASLALAAQVFERGEALVWFAEGGTTRDGKMQRFQAGIGVLVERHRLPVVPAAIEGTFEAWPYGAGFPPRPHPVRVRFGPPVDPAPLIAAANGKPQAIADALHDIVETLVGA